MAKALLVAGSENLVAKDLKNALCQEGSSFDWELTTIDDFCGGRVNKGAIANWVYLPSPGDSDGMTPDIAEAEAFFDRLAEHLKHSSQDCQLVLLSSALIYGAEPARQGMVNENYSAADSGTNPIRERWNLLEKRANTLPAEKLKLTILRPATLVPSQSLLANLARGRFAVTLPGHDPTLQFLDISDLVQAICCGLKQCQTGTYNVAPDGVVSLHGAIQLAGANRIAIPRTLQRIVKSPAALEYLRYSSTIANEKIKHELGFVPRKSSAAAISSLAKHKSVAGRESSFDNFGMDRQYIDFYSKTLFRFLYDCYWRVEEKGLEHIPRQGRGVLVGTHRGFMPFDGVMSLQLLVTKAGRVPRFMTHASLLKFPFLGNFMTKLGGMIACQESGDYVLRNNELLGIFPEGIAGAFTLYREAYKLRPFSRDAFVKIALRNSAPIIPFVTIGSAEIFPIVGKIKSRAWTRYAEWPFIPITTPVPLPSKWHIQFLPAIPIEERYPPEAAQNPSVVKAISLEVRTAMQRAIDEMRSKRRSIFWGSIFTREAEAVSGRGQETAD